MSLHNKYLTINIYRGHTRIGQLMMQIQTQDVSRLLNHHSKCAGFRPKGSPQLFYCVGLCPYRPFFMVPVEVTQFHEGFRYLFYQLLSSSTSTGRLGGK